MSYSGIVCQIHVRPHPNADRLQIGTCAGHQVIVGLDAKDGECGVFFPTDGQLSHDFCLANHLYSESALNELGIYAGDKFGFFSANRRVRAQNFRGVKSDGFWVPCSYFDYIFATKSLNPADMVWAIGDPITTFMGEPICEKYYTPATLKAMRVGKQGKPKKQNAMFPKHTDTAQFRYLTSLPDDAIVYITEKLHGTSGRYGHVQEELPLKWWQKLLRRQAGRIWTYLNGSRNVVLGSSTDTNGGFYGSNEFRYNVVRNIQLRKGEVIFFEIVGYVHGEQKIMPAHDVTKLKDKELQKLYGKTVEYTYGCQPGEHKMYVYKIALYNEDGHGEELSWTQMKRRCDELGLQTVPLLAVAKSVADLNTFQEGYGMTTIADMVAHLTEGSSILNPKQLREGVVVRIESSHGIQHIKNKSWTFGVLEGYIKESDDYVDTEEAS